MVVQVAPFDLTQRDEVMGTVRGQTVRTLVDAAGTHPGVAVRWVDGTGSIGGLTRAQYADAVGQAAQDLRAAGIGHGDVVAVAGQNHVGHLIAVLGACYAGATVTSVYRTLSVDQVRHVVGDCTPTAAVVDEALADKWADATDGTACALVTFAEASTRRPWASLPPAPETAPDAAPSPDDPAVIIYTSGTTGVPKGAVLTHGNLLYQAEAFGRAFLTEIDSWVSVSYLPLAHIAEQLFTLWVPLRVGGTVDLVSDPDALLEGLGRTRPTVFLGVPRVWEKLRAGIENTLNVPVNGDAWAPDTSLAELVLGAIGLDRCKVAASGAAPLPAAVADFFRTVGVDIIEGYGLTETTGVATVNLDRVRGSVGLPLPGVEVSVDGAGQVLVRGPVVFAGYRDGAPSDIDPDGWLHTGDIGTIGPDGHLRIVGRTKEIMITSGGKNIAPAGVEHALTSQALIAQAFAYCEGRPYVVALLHLDADAVARWANDAGGGAVPASDDPRLVREVERAVAAANESLSRPEQVKNWVVVDREFTVDRNELTPSLKFRRNVIAHNFRADLEALYAPASAP